MVNQMSRDDLIIAFWDGFSYGTAHTIATAAAKYIPIIVVSLRKKEVE